MAHAGQDMNLTEASLRNPAGVLVARLMVAPRGSFALVKLSIQLFPDIEAFAIGTAVKVESP